MEYSKIQKSISSLVLFSMLFGLTFRVPFFDYKTYAGSSDYYDLVSIIIDENTYDEVKSEVKRYAEDIQGVLENTKVVIIPTPINIPSFNIASLNEGLYYNGYKSINSKVDFESKLKGTVIIGDFNLPVVYDGTKSSRTIVPFTDFEDKVYVYDHKTKTYIKSKNNQDGLKSEIWHGVISPNIGSFDENIKGLKEYFDKNHDFYEGTGNFKLSNGILNGNVKETIDSNYKPFVFYYDQFREEKALNYTMYKGYEAYLNNKEDLVYNRFTKELADKISDAVLGKATNEISTMVDSLSEKIDSLGEESPFKGLTDDMKNMGVNGPDTKKSPDIQTRFITENMTKKFLEIFAKGIIGDFRSDVHNAGRYNGLGGEVNADLIPYLVTVLDLVNDGIIKDVNTEIENKIDDLVKKGLSRNIAIPVSYSKTVKKTDTSTGTVYNGTCQNIDENFLYGKNATLINTASECSIYKGNTQNGGKLVEANRGLNVNLSESDKNRIDNLYCLQNLSSGKSLKGIWGGNSSLNVDRTKIGNGELVLATHNSDSAIESLFDIGGSKESLDDLKNPSPLDCFDNNLLSTLRQDWNSSGLGNGGEGSTYECETEYKIKSTEGTTDWLCTTDNSFKSNSFNTRFEDFYKANPQNLNNNFNLGGLNTFTCNEDNCHDEVIHSGEYKIEKKGYDCIGGNINSTCEYVGPTETWNFKFIPSYITHKSPTSSEIKGEIKAQMTSDLPVDKDRYIDFIGAKGNLLKIDYPALFRVNVGDKTKITLDSVSASLEAVLRKKSIEINKLINENNPSSLSGKDLELYNILKVKDSSYPSADFNLLQFLRDKPAKTIKVGNEEKTISYYDTLVFAIYWNNLSSVSAKYGAIFDNYLNDDLGSDSKYFLPKNKKEYEISYLGAPGDSRNMYIKMDPEGKGENPYSGIISDNLNLSSALLGANIGDKGNIDDEEGLFKCAPPDGVPIWEWIPAIMCRLGEMMPPSISLSDGSCGPSLLDLLSDEEKAELNQCNGDFDKNGINDCIENKLGNNGILELVSDSEKYFYNKFAKLHATFKDKKGKIVTLLNNSKVRFEIVRIEVAKDNESDISSKNKKVVYDINDSYKNDPSIISEYVTFKDLEVPVSLGKAEYGVGLKGIDANIYLKASISIKDSEKKESIFLESNDLLLKIRGDRLFNTSYKIYNDEDGLVVDGGVDYLKVNDKLNLFIADKNNGGIDDIQNIVNNASLAKEKSLIILDNISSKGKSIPIEYPLNVRIVDSKGKVVKEINYTKNNLKTFKGVIGIKKSGSYKIEIKDSKGFTTIKNIEFIHEIPHTVETNLGATIMEKGGNVSTNFFTIYDKYLNVVTGDFINYKIFIDGKGVVFLDNELNTYEGTTFEGYKVFRLKSTDKIGKNTINVILYDEDGNELIVGKRNIDILNKINFEISSISKEFKVGYNKYKFKIKLKDEKGNLLTNFNSRVYLNGNPVYIKTSGSYVKLINGEAEIEFETKTVAGKNIGLEFQVEGLSDIIKKEVTILPEKPVKVDLVLSQNKIEASPDASSTLHIELKDRYNNVVFNDNNTKTTIEILDQYSSIISSDKTISKVKQGVSDYKISGTLNPGVAYFKVNTVPSLSNNSFIVKDKKSELKVKGVGSNATKIETFYFWNNSKIKDKRYNSLYTTLLGSNYGDIYEEGYLAGSLLFNKNNRSLAVTSLLNNPFKYSDVLNLSENGKLTVVHSSSDLTQDISVITEFINNKLALNLFNNALKTYIGKIYYNFDDKTNLIACESEIENCIDENDSSIILKSLSPDYSVYLSGDKLIFRNINGKNLFTINQDGTIVRTGISSFSFNEKNIGDYLSVNIKSGSQIIGELGFNLKGADTNISRNDNSFNIKTNTIKNSILVLLKSNSYGVHNSGNKYSKAISFYYNDPFKNDKALDDFSKDNNYGIENFFSKSGIGWKEGNKSLLEFAAGKSVGDSVKDFMSFSVINLGDPVIGLKKITKKLTGTNIDRQFDSTIGKILSNDGNIKSYRTFDYDNDDKTDLLLIKDDKYLKLLENKDITSGVLDKGNLALIVDQGALDLIKTGDFTGDGYDDIFFVNKKGNPYLLNNVNKDFIRYSLIKEFNLNGKIVRAESFDMDNDGITDIVTLDDSGEINIFYGKGDSINPKFTKLTVSKGNGVKLNDEPRSDNSLVYFDGLHQPSTNQAESNEFERHLYIKYPFSNEKEDIDYKKVLGGELDLPEERSSSYFMKTEYSKYSGLKVEKIYKDVNEGFLSSGDIINVNITVKNISDKNIKNIVFAEKVPEAFSIDESSIKVIGDKNTKISGGDVGYNFLISNLNLNVGDEIIINYKAKVRPIQYSYMEVGLFEKGEVGDDNFGDIIIKKDNQNCSNPIKLFRSTAIRSYLLGTKVPSCDENKVSLPVELEKNTIDKDGNGIPDYIDELSDRNNTSAIQNYAEEQLANMNKDSDNDGIPDDEDFLEGSVLDSLFTGSAGFYDGSFEGSVNIGLGEDLQKVDSQLDGIQEVLNGLNCGNASCFASPLNWAPLAPGSDPVFMGKTIGDGLKIDEGLPIISAMTGFPLYGPWGCIPIPMIWPMSPIGLDTTCTSNSLGAGGRLGIDSVTNFFRLFITPTLTGGIGTAICFGSPARISGNIMPQGLSPLFPGGNCIVIAKKMDFCNGDGSDGDPGSIGIPNYSGDGSFGVINGNCGTKQTPAEKAKEDQTVLQKLLTLDNGKAVKKIFGYLPGDFSEEPITPLFTEGGADSTVTIDLSTDEEGNFGDIIKVQQTRISSFPSWLMDWVTRQIEEIANKLTDFPTVFIILPDFSGVFDGTWGETSGNNNKSSKKTITTNNKYLDKKVEKINSGIQEAYEYIGALPLVYIKQETVDINLPWISMAEINKTILLRENTLKQWESEINRAKKEFSEFPKSNINGDINIDFDIDFLLDGLRNNLEVIKEYKKIPEKINKLINLKQDYLEQILCNIEIISNILGGRIGKNGDRFKAWVELYILIKAILKSWQLLIDVFIDFESECHECKNERQDALDQEFNAISMVVPKIPIIKFPKWPDIIIDLHNIRAGLTVSLPEFAVNTKPIVLPALPALYLPSMPEININANLSLSLSEMLKFAGFDLPQLPVLPELEIPELPPIPSLPTINLPDLPPPPKLPKLLASIEVVLDIIKLITKAMCILKSLPIHPEWRAGDQIAFLTERSGYLGSDFFEMSMPEFSFPFIDAIKVTTYVNMEFDTDFIVELARQIVMPINNFSNDFTNIFSDVLPDLDLRGALPREINIDVNIDTEALKKLSEGDMSPIKDQIEGNKKGIEKEIENSNNRLKDSLENIKNTSYKDKLNILLASKVSADLRHLLKVLDEGKDDTVTNIEFKRLVNKALSSDSVTKEAKMDKILALWKEVNDRTTSKEDSIIKELKENNRMKFETLKDIINTEIIKNKDLKNKFKNIGLNPIVTKVGFENNNIDLYNKSLEKYNNKFKNSAKKLFEYDGADKKELKEMSNNLISRIKTPLQNYTKGKVESSRSKILAATNTDISVNSDTVNANSCQGNEQNSQYKREYKGIYILENNKSYRLFDYLDELNGDEVTKIIDIDNDGDEDLLYFSANRLYLKENLKVQNEKSHVSTNPIVVSISDNKYFNGDIFYESINNAHEIGSDNGSINIGFSSPTNDKLNKFRLAFYNRVDKYLNEKNNNYRPKFIKKDIIDAVSEIDSITKKEETVFYIKRDNLVYIKNVGKLKGAKLETKEIKNISQDIKAGKVVNINKGTKIFAGANDFTIRFLNTESGDKQELSLKVSRYQNVEFKHSIKIIGVDGDAFIRGFDNIIYNGIDIRKLLNKPLSVGTIISYEGNKYETVDSSYIELEYHDKSSLSIDFNNTYKWELYDLGVKTEDYSIRTKRDNDYYYAKINTFNNDIEGTLSKQILIAPQNEADINAPELTLSSIRIPVYQKHLIDLTKDIYEDSGISNIKKVIVDFDLDKDSDNDGNSKNDDDLNIIGEYKNQINILKNPAYLKFEFKAFDKLFKKKIGITLIDKNDNAGYNEVLLEVYSPIPHINSYKEGNINGVLINENLTKEPVNLYRFRGGVLTKLEDISGNDFTFTDNGNYKFSVKTEGNGLKLYNSDKKEIAFINEKTGKIFIKDRTITNEVLSSSSKKNDSVFPKILLKKDGRNIFYEYLQVKGIDEVKFVNNFEEVFDRGIYFKFSDYNNYSYYTIPLGLDYNPGALSIYRNTNPTKESLFTIFNDGRINTINDNDFSIKYDFYGDDIVLKLYDKNDFGRREIGRVLFKVESEYIMK